MAPRGGSQSPSHCPARSPGPWADLLGARGLEFENPPQTRSPSRASRPRLEIANAEGCRAWRGPACAVWGRPSAVPPEASQVWRSRERLCESLVSASVPCLLGRPFQVSLFKEQKQRVSGVHNVHAETPVHRERPSVCAASAEFHLVSAAGCRWVSCVCVEGSCGGGGTECTEGRAHVWRGACVCPARWTLPDIRAAIRVASGAN